jgi:PRC-barrel domain
VTDDSAADPVAWLLIKPGWDVVDAGGQDAGRVVEVTGDSTEDIFNGLAVDTGLFEKPRYVPAELVGRIVEGRVHLTFPKAELERMAEYEEPPESVEISSEKAGLATRLEEAVTVPERREPEPVPFTRRLWLRIKRLFG